MLWNTQQSLSLQTTLNVIYQFFSHSDSIHLQQDLDSLFGWSTENLLSFKLSKCVVLQCLSSSMSPNTVYNLNNSELSVVSQHKDLGILFTANLAWNSHYEAITTKALKSIGLICRTFSNATSVIATRLYSQINFIILFPLVVAPLD